MRYKITHTTRYEYAEVVPFCQNIVYLTPRNSAYQHCSRHRITCRPEAATTHQRLDYFGNAATVLSIDKGHRSLQLTATSSVEVSSRELPEAASTPDWTAVRDQLPLDRTAEGVSNLQFAFRSPHVPFCDAMRAYGAASFPVGRPILECLSDLNRRIHADFQYDPEATNVSTPIADVFLNRRGVCQDLAHVMLGCLRPLGLAARYVSGYLRTHPPDGRPRLTGADASHAWVSVFCGPCGWIDVDPTNNLFPSIEHITVAWGRDYSDVCPVTGMYIGGRSHALHVTVDVEPVDLPT